MYIHFSRNKTVENIHICKIKFYEPLVTCYLLHMPTTRIFWNCLRMIYLNFSNAEQMSSYSRKKLSISSVFFHHFHPNIYLWEERNLPYSWMKTDTCKCEHSGECIYFSVHGCPFLIDIRIYFLELEDWEGQKEV